MKVWTIILQCLFTCEITMRGFSQSLNETTELLHNVLRNYDSRVRPTLNQSRQTVINVTFAVLSIEDIDEVEAKFAMTGFLHMTWLDEIITWNVTETHVRSLTFPVNDVWHPVLVLAYPHGKADDFIDDWMTVEINSSGHATLAPLAVFRSTCNIDVTYFPFDIQTCDLSFIPWAYRYDIKLNPASVIGGGIYIGHGEWEILSNYSFTLSRNSILVITFNLQRKPLFVVVNTIIPIIILSFLNILIFVLPPQSGERIGYGITVLLAMAVFLTIVGDTLPKTSAPMSALSFFLIANLVLSGLICLSAILNLCIFFRVETKVLPAWALWVVRLTSCNKYRLPASKESSKKQDRTDPEDNVDVTCVVEPEKILTWNDVSKCIDKVCIAFFFCCTVATSTIFVCYVRNGTA